MTPRILTSDIFNKFTNFWNYTRKGRYKVSSMLFQISPFWTPSVFYDTSVAAVRICEVGTTLAPFNVGALKFLYTFN
jgi:hypothetical protein